MAEKEVKIKVITEADASDLDELQDKLKENQKEAEQTSEALQSAFEEATAKVEELEDALDEAYINGDDIEADIIADELAEAREEAEQLEQQLNDFDSSGLENAREGADDLAQSLKGANTESQDLSDSMGLIEGTMMLDLANQAGQLGGTAEGMAQEMDSAAISIGQLATQTAIAEPQMRGLISYISNATFPQEEAMAYVQALNQMGVAGSNFAESATDMDRINDAFHIGYSNVIQLTKGMSALGVDANNLDSSFNALYYAQTHVNGGVDTLNTALGRNASKFTDLGLNIDQVALIMDKASHKWTTARTLNTGLSQALKNCNGDLGALEQELGLASGSLQHASEITGQYDGKLQELADEEREHKTLTQQLGALWEDLTMQLSPVLSPLMSFIGLVGQFGQMALAANSIITLAETFGILKKAQLATIPTQIAEGFAGNFSISWMLVLIAIGVAVGLIFIYLYNNSEQFRNAINWLGQGIMFLVTNPMQAIKMAINSFINSLSAIPQAIQNCLNWATNLILNHPIVRAIKYLGEQLAYIFSFGGLGQRSPGKIYKALKLELDSSEEMVEDSNLPSMFGTFGNKISGEFNPNLNSFDSSNLSNNLIVGAIDENKGQDKSVINNTFNIDYLSKKEFVQDIIDIITNEVNWDNKTAGRGV